MAIAGFVEGMGDHKLKPRLLSSLVRERLPGGDGAAGSRPSPSPAELSSVLAAVKTHGLLAEAGAAAAAAASAGRPDPELAESWRGAVDAWADRVLSLVSSNAVAVSGLLSAYLLFLIWSPMFELFPSVKFLIFLDFRSNFH